jgi:hypothetical protein
MKHKVTFDILPVVMGKITSFWDVTQCSLVHIYRRLEDLLNREDGGKHPFYMSVNIYQNTLRHIPEGLSDIIRFMECNCSIH